MNADGSEVVKDRPKGRPLVEHSTRNELDLLDKAAKIMAYFIEAMGCEFDNFMGD